MKQALAIAALLLVAGSAYAEGKREAKPLACLNFNEFRDANGVTMGVCGASKPGGKPRYLRTFQIVSIVNPETEKAVKTMVGFP